MGEVRFVGAAAVAVNTDLLKDNEFQKVPYPRLMTARMITGSAVAGDSTIDLFVGETRIGSLVNTSTGEGAANVDLYPQTALIPANVSLRAIVKVSPTTNPIIGKVFWR